MSPWGGLRRGRSLSGRTAKGKRRKMAATGAGTSNQLLGVGSGMVMVARRGQPGQEEEEQEEEDGEWWGWTSLIEC